MVLNIDETEMSDADQLNPMQIARHTVFTAREKLDLLDQLRDEMGNGEPAAFEPQEIDAAIAHVRDRAARQAGSETVLRGAY